MKADTDELHAIFLLKKNARQDIIKTILGYPPCNDLKLGAQVALRQRLEEVKGIDISGKA